MREVFLLVLGGQCTRWMDSCRVATHVSCVCVCACVCVYKCVCVCHCEYMSVQLLQHSSTQQHSTWLYVMLAIYRMAGNFGGEFILADWQF